MSLCSLKTRHTHTLTQCAHTHTVLTGLLSSVIASSSFWGSLLSVSLRAKLPSLLHLLFSLFFTLSVRPLILPFLARHISVPTGGRSSGFHSRRLIDLSDFSAPTSRRRDDRNDREQTTDGSRLLPDRVSCSNPVMSLGGVASISE